MYIFLIAQTINQYVQGNKLYEMLTKLLKIANSTQNRRKIYDIHRRLFSDATHNPLPSNILPMATNASTSVSSSILVTPLTSVIPSPLITPSILDTPLISFNPTNSISQSISVIPSTSIVAAHFAKKKNANMKRNEKTMVNVLKCLINVKWPEINENAKKYINEHIKQKLFPCILNYETLRKNKKSIVCYMYCKFRTCRRFRITINQLIDSKCSVEVEATSHRYVHRDYLTAQLRGQERVTMKERLKNHKPSVVQDEEICKADDKLIKQGIKRA